MSRTYTETEFLRQESTTRGFARIAMEYEQALLAVVGDTEGAKAKAIKALGWEDVDEGDARQVARSVLAEGGSVRRACDDLTAAEKAAPALLAACEEALRMLADAEEVLPEELDTHQGRMLRAALAKARGEVEHV